MTIPFLISFAESAIKTCLISVLLKAVGQHKRDSLIFAAAFCLANIDSKSESSAPAVSLLAFDDTDVIITGVGRRYFASVIARRIRIADLLAVGANDVYRDIL